MAKNKSTSGTIEKLESMDPDYKTSEQHGQVEEEEEEENQAPQMMPLQNLEGHPTVQLQFIAMAMDPDGDALTFSLVSAPTGAQITAAGGSFTWTPTWNQLGAHTITVRVTDPGGLSDTRSCTITVANQPPEVFPLMDIEAHPGVPVNFIAMANDPDGDQVTFSLVNSSPGQITTQGSYTWTPGWGNIGPKTVSVRATDPGGLSDTKSCVINVRNQPPQLMPLADIEAHPTVPVGFIAMAMDPDGDSVTYSLINSPGSITPQGGLYSWTPNWNQVGAHTVTVRAVDPGALSDTRTCTITVINRAPELMPLADQEVTVGNQLTFLAMAMDPDADPLTYSLISPPPGAAITANGGSFTWTPADGQEGQWTITIRVADPGGLSDTRSCTVTVLEAP